MKKNNIYPMTQAILAAVLFGACTPISKLLLGDIEPIPVATFLYLGSGVGMLLFGIIRRMKHNFTELEAKFGKNDLNGLLGQ